jgi:tetratricopeptide (TPR) repeat protein
MRRVLVSASILVSCVALWSTPAFAQSAAAKKDGAKAEVAKADKGPRKDPAGVTGISPFMEQINKGEAAFVARDFAGAVAAFQEAVKLDGQAMLGFYRLGEAQLAAGKPDEADAVWQTALGKKGPEDLNAKVLFVIADLRERQKKLQAAKDAWAAYTAFVQGHSKANGYPASATERQKQIDRRMKDEKDYAVVKERIIKREAERTKEAEANAKKDKLNR